MATTKVGTRGKPNSPLHLGVSDLEHILKKYRKIRRSQSSPSLFSPDQLELASSFAFLEFQIEEDFFFLVSPFYTSRDPSYFHYSTILSKNKN